MDARVSETLWPEDSPDDGDDFEEPAESDCDPNWVKHVSFEDDHGVIHEIEIPGPGIPRQVFLPLMIERLRNSTPYRVVVETLSDKLIVAYLGFLTFLIVNMVLGLSDPPATEFKWCVYSMSRGRCVADTG
jgi:hypothetical protein